jgi:hypothetical protein
MSIITITITGTVSAYGHGQGYGIDTSGIFGPVGASLVDLPFTVVWVGEDCNCAATYIGDVIQAGNFQFNPVINATLTIAGTTYDFGAGNVANDFYNILHQVQTVTPSGERFSLTTAIPGFGENNLGPRGSPDGTYPDGVFYIPASGTHAYLEIPQPIPGPILGQGIAGLLLAVILVTILWKSRTIFVDNPSRSCHHARYGPFAATISLAKP